MKKLDELVMRARKNQQKREEDNVNNEISSNLSVNEVKISTKEDIINNDPSRFEFMEKVIKIARLLIKYTYFIIMGNVLASYVMNFNFIQAILELNFTWFRLIYFACLFVFGGLLMYLTNVILFMLILAIADKLLEFILNKEILLDNDTIFLKVIHIVIIVFCFGIIIGLFHPLPPTLPNKN